MTAQIEGRGLVVVCASCATRNRIPFAATQAKCGKCGAALSLPGEPIEVPNVEAFDSLVAGAKLPVVVDFWAPWCAPCRMVAPELARVAAANAGRYIVVKVNTDAVPELGDRFSIRSIPTMSVFSGGRETARTSGARPAADIEAFIRQSLAS